MLGYVECFNSNFFCRLCKMPKFLCQSSCIEDRTLLRNINNYTTDIEINNCKATGIKEESIWNKLNYFHVVKNLVVDVMHDLLEGVCWYDLIFVIEALIKKYNFFTLDILNYRILTFNYGPVNKKNKPPCLYYSEKGKLVIKFSAAEMLNFVINFPLLVGDLVQECDEWTLLLLLKDIIDISFNVNFYEQGTEKLLNELIFEHNSIYLMYNDTLKPKYHNLLHYSLIMRNVGPLKHLASMRFESVHQFFKKTSCSSNSRVNLLKTNLTRYQLFFANMLLNPELYFSENIEKGKIIALDATLMNLKFKLENAAHIVSYILYNEVFYKKDVVVLLDADDESLLPEFGLIHYICYNKIEYYLCVQKLYTHGYDPHFKAYIVDIEDYFFFNFLETCLFHFK